MHAREASRTQRRHSSREDKVKNYPKMHLAQRKVAGNAPENAERQVALSDFFNFGWVRMAYARRSGKKQVGEGETPRDVNQQHWYHTQSKRDVQTHWFVGFWCPWRITSGRPQQIAEDGARGGVGGKPLPTRQRCELHPSSACTRLEHIDMKKFHQSYDAIGCRMIDRKCTPQMIDQTAGSRSSVPHDRCRRITRLECIQTLVLMSPKKFN